MTNRQIVVAALPSATLGTQHFGLRQAPMPQPKDGEVLLRTILMSIDAANRAWMQGDTYRGAVVPGDPMPTYAICEVVQSNVPHLIVGDIVGADSIWADYVAKPAKKVQKLPRIQPLTHLLSVYGIAGKTAFHGLLNIGRPVAGETVVVSAAAGSVGSYVGQIAKALGCRVIGIAGGADKCAHVRDILGFDACIDYKAGGVFKALRAVCHEGIDVYFDNVGGPTLETVLALMNEKGRIVCCGAISQYDTDAPTGPRNLPGVLIVKRLAMQGFIVMDFARDDDKATRALHAWVKSGQIKVTEDIIHGLENAPAALVGLLRGDNRGKRMVRVGADPT